MSPDSGLPCSVRLVLVALDNYRSDKSPVPYPSQAALAADSGLSERHVRRALKVAEATGWVRRQPNWTREGRTNDRYELLIPLSQPDMMADRQEPTGQSVQPTGQNDTTQPDTVSGEVVHEVSNRIDKTTTMPTAARPAGVALVVRAEQITEQLAPWHDVEQAAQMRVSADDRRELQQRFLFAYWAKMYRHEGALYDPKRARILRARLVENRGNVSELLFAFDGGLKDDHLMGRTSSNSTKYDGIETLMRDRAQVEKLTRLAGMNGKPHPMALKYAALCLAEAPK